MKSNKDLGTIALGIWLVLSGLMSAGVFFQGLQYIAALLAVAAGVLMLADVFKLMDKKA